MVLSYILITILGFMIYLAYSLPVFLYDRGIVYWKARAMYHVFIFLTVGLAPLILNTFIDLLLFTLLLLLAFLIHLSITKSNLINRLYDFMRRKGVSQSQRGVYTVITNLGLLILLILTWNVPIYFTLGLVTLAFADKLGEAVGRVEGDLEYEIMNTKTIEGSVTVALTSVVVIITGLWLYGSFRLSDLPIYLVIGIVIAIIEGISVKFLDNLLIPYTVALGMFLFIPL